MSNRNRIYALRSRLRPPAGALAGGWCLVLAACGSEFAGTWKGTCDVGVGSRGTEVPVKFEVGDEGRDQLSGKGEFEYNDYVFKGAANGRVVDDEALKIDIEGVSGGYVIQLEIEVEQGVDELEGICAFTDQDTLYEGDVVLTQPGSD